MRIWHAVLILAVIYGLATDGRAWWLSRSQARLVQKAVASGSRDLASVGVPTNCAGKKFCITVFIAPWCGVCRNSEPTFKIFNQYLSEKRSDIGFGLVIGAATAEQHLQKQKDLAPIESYLDDSGSLMKLRQIRAFPTWVATNQTGKEIFRQAGGMNLSSDSQMPEALEMLLGKSNN